MRSTFSIFIAALAFSAGLAATADPALARSGGGGIGGGPFGLGVVLGEPTGLSAKYRMSSRDAVDLGLAYSFSKFFTLFSDYLYHFPGVLGAQNAFVAKLTPYAGIGAMFFADLESSRSSAKFFSDSGSAGLGLRIPLGLEWKPGHPPIGVFVELVPGMGIIPSTFGFLNGGIGARFYF